jgi:predicted dehydrogenase
VGTASFGRFRWGILSTAQIARLQIVPAILASTNGIVTAVASRNLETARPFAQRFDIPLAFGSYDELLTCDEVDGIYIALPNAQHVEWTRRAADAGKHVLCEKPIAMRAAEIDALAETARRTGRLISEAYAVFHHPQWQKVRQLIENGAIGRLRQVQGAYCYNVEDPKNVRNQPVLGGGALRDVGGYPLLVTRLVTGAEPSRVQADIEFDPVTGIDSYAAIRADFGAFALDYYCSGRMALRQHMVFHGERGFIEIQAPFNAGIYDHHRIDLHDRDHRNATIFRFPGTQQYQLEVEAFAAAALGAPADVLSLHDSRRNQRAIDAIFDAARTDGWVGVDTDAGARV